MRFEEFSFCRRCASPRFYTTKAISGQNPLMSRGRSHGTSHDQALTCPPWLLKHAGPAGLMRAHTSGAWLAGHFEMLAGIGDFGPVNAKDREVSIHIVSNIDVSAIGREGDCLWQSADFDVVQSGHLLAIDFQDRHHAMRVIVEIRLRVIGAGRLNSHCDISLGLNANPSGLSGTDM